MNRTQRNQSFRKYKVKPQEGSTSHPTGWRWQSQIAAGKMAASCKRKKPGHFLTPYTTINSKWNKGLLETVWKKENLPILSVGT